VTQVYIGQKVAPRNYRYAIEFGICILTQRKHPNF